MKNMCAILVQSTHLATGSHFHWW